MIERNASLIKVIKETNYELHENCYDFNYRVMDPMKVYFNYIANLMKRVTYCHPHTTVLFRIIKTSLRLADGWNEFYVILYINKSQGKIHVWKWNNSPNGNEERTSLIYSPLQFIHDSFITSRQNNFLLNGRISHFSINRLFLLRTNINLT